jgi:hypothetical protein
LFTIDSANSHAVSYTLYMAIGLLLLVWLSRAASGLLRLWRRRSIPQPTPAR